MTREEFISILEEKGYSYRIEGEILIVDHDGDVWLMGLTSLPPNVEFRNVGAVGLRDLKALHDNIEFRNDGNVWLRSLNRLSLADMDSVFQNKADAFIGEYWINDQEFLESRWMGIELISEQ
jgi:hypothetical protein